MINTNPIVRIKRSAVPGKKPTVDQLLTMATGVVGHGDSCVAAVVIDPV
jgi:hypothetical protein